MGKTLTAIYVGDGIMRLLETMPELQAEQLLRIEILDAESLAGSNPENAVEPTPTPEAVWADMGLVQIEDLALAEWPSQSQDIMEWNQPGNEESS